MKLHSILAVISLSAAALTFSGYADNASPAPTRSLDLTDTPFTLPVQANPAAPVPQVIPVPVPVYRDPDAFQASALKWLGVATALTAAFSAFVAFVVTKLGELKRTIQTQREELGGRLDRQKGTTAAVAGQVNALAMVTPGGSQALALMAPGASATAPDPATAPNVPQAAQSATTGLVGLAIALLACLSLMGCATTGPDPVKNAHGAAVNLALTDAAKVLGQVAVSTLFNVAQQELGGGKADFGSAAASGLWSNVDLIQTGAEAMKVAQAWSGGNAPKTAAVVAQVFNAVAQDERSPETINAIATVLSAAAGAPPKL